MAEFDDQLSKAAERLWSVIQEARSQMPDAERAKADFEVGEFLLAIRAKHSIAKIGAMN